MRPVSHPPHDNDAPLPTGADLLYRHVLAPSAGLDWRRLRASVSPGRWRHMCELALIVNRYGGGYGLPLAHEGEFALLRWLAHFGSAEQVAARVEAEKNLIEAASNLHDYRGFYAELRCSLDENERWRAGPWIVKALDQLCSEVLSAAERTLHGGEADPGPAQGELTLKQYPVPEASSPLQQRMRKPRGASELAVVLGKMREDGLATVEALSYSARGAHYNTSDRTADRALRQLREETANPPPQK
jgi:hypothetical protein